MTQQELDNLKNIAIDKPWLASKLLKEYLTTVKVTEELKGTRTGQQNRALHLYFTQVAEACQNEGIEASAVFSKTHNIQMTPEAVKAMWKALQFALFGKKSTTELRKTGEIDKLQDHFIRFFAENFELTLPPFPNDEDRQLEEMAGPKLKQLNNMRDESYPEYTGETAF